MSGGRWDVILCRNRPPPHAANLPHEDHPQNSIQYLSKAPPLPPFGSPLSLRRPWRICQAITFLDGVKTSPNGWVACAQRFLAGSFDFEAAKFQCLVVIEDAIRSKYVSTSRVSSILGCYVVPRAALTSATHTTDTTDTTDTTPSLPLSLSPTTSTSASQVPRDGPGRALHTQAALCHVATGPQSWAARASVHPYPDGVAAGSGLHERVSYRAAIVPSLA